MDTQDNIRICGDKNICHGLGCFNIAKHSIKEDGYDGTLNLCDTCIKKFPREVTDKPQIFTYNRLPKQQASTPRVSMSADPLCSCKRCTNSNKKTLERQVVEPERSNVHHMRPIQQSGGSLDG